MTVAWGDQERRLTDRVSVLVGEAGGAYPNGNSLLVRGASETFLVDPSVTVASKGGAPAKVDALLHSHAHEDHMCGNRLFPEARVHIHEADLVGIQSLDGLMGIYGFPDSRIEDDFRRIVVDEFHFEPRPDARGFAGGERFDLGGLTIEAVHLPGHTRGHSGFRIEGDVFFLADIDLTGFGPYYGDAWSDLDQFEESLRCVRDEDAAWYVTFHQKGVIEGRADFLARLDGFAGVIDRRHGAMLEFLAEPRSVEEMVAHRFVYRPTAQTPIADPVERRSAELHLARMLERGEAREVERGRYQAA